MIRSELPGGWLHYPEADVLADLARDKIVLELGAYMGRSTVVLAKTATLVISVDLHDMWGEDSLPDYLKNTRSLPNVVSVIGAFDQIVPYLGGVDVVYIDGEHDADSVTQDLGMALQTGATVVAFHDWGYFDVREAAIAVLGREPDGVTDSLAHYQLAA